MANVVLEFSHEEAILMGNDAEEALRFFKEVLEPKISAKGSNELGMGKSTGIMT